MHNKNLWLYVFFGIYPVSLFRLGTSDLSGAKQVSILTLTISILLIVGYQFGFLNLSTALIVALFIIAPYVVGKLHYNGVFE